ncbi:hypothetical protein MRX96_014469 [Rhipicephalus microplus]
MGRHMSCNKNPVRHTRKEWWENEVAQAWQARTAANRAHRRAVKAKDPEGYRYLLTCVDRYSRWSEATLIVDIAAGTIAQAFVAT